MKNLFVLSFALFIGCSLNEQDFSKAKMDSLFSLIEKNNEGMGSVSIFKDGNEVYHNSIGFADIEKNIKANQNTKYRIGSISKMFTAAVVMQLVEEGKLSLDTKLSKFYPKMSNASEITIEQLLQHQSGLFNFTSDPSYLEWMESPKTKEDLLEIFKKKEAVFEPGTKSSYSNTNYVLLTFIVEDIVGKDFEKILQRRIVKPLNLENTYYGDTVNTANNEALSYLKAAPWKLATETDMSIPQGAGAIVSTPTDLNVFLSALFTGKLVSESTLEKMMEIENNFAGIGMFPIPFYDKTAFGHNGGIDGFQSMAGYFPEENVSVAYLSNAVDMPVNDIMIGVLSIYFGKGYDFPEFIPEYKVTAEDLKPYLGVYGSETFPMKITISQKGNVLVAQATGQPSFPLEAYGKHKFKFDDAKLKLEFIPEEDKMILLQGGGRFELAKE